MTNAVLRARMEREFSGTSLTAAQWNDICDDAVGMYARHRPEIVLGAIATIADTEEYALPAGGKTCLDLADYDDWADLTTLGFSLLDISEVQGDVIVDFHQPQQLDIYHSKIAARRRQTGTRWDQPAVGGTVHIYPRPTSAVALAVLYTRPHTAADTIPDGEEDLLLAAARIATQRMLAHSALVTGASVTGGAEMRLGPYTYRPGGLVAAAKLMLDEATRAEEAFDRKAYLGGIVLKGG